MRSLLLLGVLCAAAGCASGGDATSSALKPPPPPRTSTSPGVADPNAGGVKVAPNNEHVPGVTPGAMPAPYGSKG